MATAKILIIEDDPICTGLLLAILGDGYQVTTANSGQVGLEVVNALQPHLIFLDISMPDVNGYQVMQQLKQDPGTAAIPIIVISALTESFDHDLALKMGANGYLNKPIQPQLIEATLSQYLGKIA